MTRRRKQQRGLTFVGRVAASHRGDENVTTWKLPDGTEYHLLVRTRRGDYLQRPLVYVRLTDGRFDTIGTWDGRFEAEALNGWLAPRGIRI